MFDVFIERVTDVTFTMYEKKLILESLAERVMLGHGEYVGFNTAMKGHALYFIVNIKITTE